MTESPPVLSYSPDPRPIDWRPFYAPAAVVVLIVVALSFWQTRKPNVQAADFGAYYRAGQKVLAGTTPYALDPPYNALGAYMYSPAFAYWACGPLARLPYLWAVRSFLLLNWVATAACVGLCSRVVPPPRRFPAMAAATAVVGTYFWADLHNGQVGTLLLLACLGWFSLTLSGRSFAGGLLLAVAIGLKIYPALLGPYLLLRRDWRGVAGVLVGSAVLFVAPAPWVGLRALPAVHHEWIAFCLQTQEPVQSFRDGNQSLLGVLARTRWVSDGTTLYSPDHLKTLAHLYPAVVVFVTVTLYAALWAVGRRRPDPWTDLSLLLLWVTVASPRAWTFNFAAELVAAAVLVRGRLTTLSVVALGGVVLAITFPTNLLRLPAHWSLGYALLRDKHFDAAVLLAAAVAAVRGRAVTPDADRLL